MHEKTTSPRSCLRWQPTGRILKTVCLRWVPTGKTFASSTTKVESEPPNGSNADIPNQCESEQAINVSAGTLLSTGLVTSSNDFDHNRFRTRNSLTTEMNRQSSKLVPKVVPLAVQDSYITTRVGITIPPSHSNAKDNRKEKGLKKEPLHKLLKAEGNTGSIHYAVRITRLIVTLKNDIMEHSDAMQQTLPAIRVSSQTLFI
ncbi:hypothetical protein Tco_1375540 [Tanacetum coccineum]